MCCCFGWDKDGDLLAVITDKSSDMLVWDAHAQKSQWLDTGIAMCRSIFPFLLDYLDIFTVQVLGIP